MSVGGTNRYYLVYTPTSYDPNTALPMVFILHGMNMNNWWAANDSSGFKMIEASSNKAILVYPQGSGDAPGTTSKWGNINSNWSDSANGADMKFIDALLTSMEDSYCVDTSRIFVTGFSMGGMMTESLACGHSKVFRAYAPVAGWGPGGMGGMSNPSCSDASVAVPIIITQGSSDGTVQPAYGQASRDFWINRDGCTKTTSAVTVPSGQASCVAYQGCKTGLAVDYCTHSGDHMVPNNAGGYIWSFFSSFN
jgi:polyhydroxybutyrate depolymerase